MDSQLLRISFIGPDSLRSFQAPRLGTVIIFSHTSMLDSWNYPNLPGEALRFLAPNLGLIGSDQVGSPPQRWP